jgi:hypothetical protein
VKNAIESRQTVGRSGVTGWRTGSDRNDWPTACDRRLGSSQTTTFSPAGTAALGFFVN